MSNLAFSDHYLVGLDAVHSGYIWPVPNWIELCQLMSHEGITYSAWDNNSDYGLWLAKHTVIVGPYENIHRAWYLKKRTVSLGRPEPTQVFTNNQNTIMLELPTSPEQVLESIKSLFNWGQS